MAGARVRVLILRAAGTNCDLETQHAWELAGAEAERVHVRRLLETPPLLDSFQIVTIPGGFSYGDDIGAGQIFAAQLRRGLGDDIRNFVARGGLLLGICNGFQVLVKAGLLPDPSAAARTCTITCNEPRGFQDRWVTLAARQSPCVVLEPGRTYEMPIAHGEGRVTFVDDASRRASIREGHIALCYVATDAGAQVNNPNGSEADIAGLCDQTGRIFGLMPHPERFVTWQQYPCWTSRPPREQGDGLAVFQRAVAHFH